MAKRTLDAHRSDAAVGICEGGDADDGIQLKKGNGGRWIVEINFARRELFLQSLRQRVGVHFKSDRQSGFRRNARTDTAVLLACDGFVQLERIAPEGLTSECLEAEGLLALFEHGLRVTRDVRVEACLAGRGREGKRSAE